jgi:hypothetical protein
MDEGEIKISMKYLDNTFFDYYQLDSMYFTSTLLALIKQNLFSVNNKSYLITTTI